MIGLTGGESAAVTNNHEAIMQTATEIIQEQEENHKMLEQRDHRRIVPLRKEDKNESPTISTCPQMYTGRENCSSAVSTEHKNERAIAENEYRKAKFPKRKPFACQHCGEECFNPNIEAYEICEKLICDECADELFEANGQFGGGS